MDRRAFLAALAGAAVAPALPGPGPIEPGTVFSMDVTNVFLLAPGDIVTFGDNPQKYVIAAPYEHRIDWESGEVTDTMHLRPAEGRLGEFLDVMHFCRLES